MITCMRGNTKQRVKDGLAFLWHHGHFNTSLHRNAQSFIVIICINMKLCALDYVDKMNVLAKWFEFAGWVQLDAYVKYTPLVIFLPYSLSAFFSCSPAQAKRVEIRLAAQ